jgi:hypothetical protein
MTALIPLILAATVQPSPNDFERFGLDLVPAVNSLYQNSDTRQRWLNSRAYRYRVERFAASWGGYGRDCTEIVKDAIWRERVWDAADDLADRSRCDLGRYYAAVRLREYLGPVDFAAGRLPEPVPGELP